MSKGTPICLGKILVVKIVSGGNRFMIKKFLEKCIEIEDKDFLQAKWDYYSKFTIMVVLFGSLSSILFFVSDCQLFGRIAWETLLPRLYIILPLIFYYVLIKRVKNYKILSVATLMMCHAIMWCTIGAIIYLPDKTHASEGFVIMNLLFFGVSFGTPFLLSSIMHIFMLFNIFVTNLFIHYSNVDIMYSLNIPCIFGIIAASYALDSVYMDNYRMTKQLKENMVTDALTGCFNRHKLMNYVSNNSLDKLGNFLYLILLDIDYFKKVNDTYGHEAGDEVLKYVADCVRKVIRNEDMLIRWGGEEFLIILKKCTVDGSKMIAERIRKQIEEGENGVCKVTVSQGVMQYKRGSNYLDAIEQADVALYTAKRTGRNKVVYYDEICSERKIFSHEDNV